MSPYTVHVTDIHCAFDKIEKLQQWLRVNNKQVDMVFISGDIADVPAEFYNNTPEELRKEHDLHLKNITNSFINVAPLVYFIPGNVRTSY